MKYFVVTDVHGFYTLMKQALDNAGFDPSNPGHVFISCGDLLDRGLEANECLDYVLSLPHKVLISGNHEDLMEDAIIKGAFLEYDFSNGTADTAMQLTHTLNANAACTLMPFVGKYNQYCHQLVDYFETEHAVFVHGWIPCNYNQYTKKYSAMVDWKEASHKQWKDAKWINGMNAWYQGVTDTKTIFCGHWHSSWGLAHIHGICKEWDNPYSTNPEHRIFHSEPFIDKGIVALDACTAYSHKVNCYVWEDEPVKESI